MVRELTTEAQSGIGHGPNQAALLKDLKKQVSALEDDLRARSESVGEYDRELRAEWNAARQAERIAATYEAWREERLTQVAAAWVLGCVFVRFCEDNGLIAEPWLAGPGERMREVEDREADFFRKYPEKNDRDWIEESFAALAGTHPAVTGLFSHEYNPLWQLEPGYEAASALLKFWRRVDADGKLVHDFTDAGLGTRFLGDLYQNLSEHAGKTFALLQTPKFVEEFILDLTLTPALEEFGLDVEGGLRTIDPACGSGHFLLGLFGRLLAAWRKAEPGAPVDMHVRRALESVHGCDKNPFAAQIARFRLLVAALKTCEVEQLELAPDFPTNVAVGDSLLHGRGAPTPTGMFVYRTEDIWEFSEKVDLLGIGSYHLVVGNPPYITVKDKQENNNYRAYKSCSGKYGLSVPFTERLFQLAIRTDGADRRAGYVGEITSNSFMKREFGKKLISELFTSGWKGVHVTHIIDTSGAYIPGHGTPTVILVGRNHPAQMGEPVRAVLGVRGEPSQPEDARRGLVWRAIVDQVGKPGSESEWVSVDDIHRATFSTFPWSLSGGRSKELIAKINDTKVRLGGRIPRPIGFASFPGQDEVFFLSKSWFRHSPAAATLQRQLITGEVLRDWEERCTEVALVPIREDQTACPFAPNEYWGRHVWLHRTVLRPTTTFAGHTQTDLLEASWWTWYRWIGKRYETPLSIAFAFVATHNHFVLDRGGKAFNRSAPVIKLPEGASEDEHLALLGVLNSSAACFWLRQSSHNKGRPGAGQTGADEPWEHRYEFTGTKLQDFPLPVYLPSAVSRALDAAARELAKYEPSAVAASCSDTPVPTRAALDAARVGRSTIRARMIALQDELDWEVYSSYGLIAPSEPRELDALPEISLGERPFEIVLARRIAAGEAETAWFDRHGSTPITEIPSHWPEWYRALVQSRIDLINSNKNIALLERPEYKRRWATDPWEKKEREALRAWLLDKAEDRRLWFALRDGFEQPRTLTVSQLADALSKLHPDTVDVATLYATDHLGKRDLPLEDVLAEIVATEHVPYLAAFRYKDSGLRKRAQWEETWAQQRIEDETGERLDIPVPPKYTGADFLKQSYWSNRGKLDVPKERFTSYPDANPDADPTLLLGWAGWDHRDQAQALINLVKDRASQLSWGPDRLTPLLAGLAEQLPWLRQWFNTDDPEWGANAAEEFTAFFEAECAKLALSPEQLAAWRPTPKSVRSRKSSTSRKPKKS